MIFIHVNWFAILYIKYELSKILEKHYYNNICTFYEIINEFYEDWYTSSSGLAAIWVIGAAISKTISEIMDRAASETASGAVGKAINRVVWEAIGGITSKADNRTTGRAANEVASRANSRATNRTAGRAFDSFIVGATSRAIDKVADEARTIRVWKNRRIILTNSSVYVLKLEK